jgi:Peptidase family M28
MRRISIGLALFALAGRLSAQTTDAITAADLKSRLFLLAHDSMAGRATGSEGGFKAAEYIAREFTRLGLAPAGDNGGYFQVIPFFRVRPDPEATLVVDGKPLTLGAEVLPLVSAEQTPSITNSSVVVGGSISDSSTWIPAKDAEGKLVLLRMPGALSRTFNAMLGRVRRSPHFAQARLIAVVALERLGPDYRAALLDGRVTTDTARRGGGPMTALVSEPAADRLLGRSFADAAPGTAGRTVGGDLRLGVYPMKYPVRNVVAIRRGTDPARQNTYVAVTAHSDHVGFDHTPVDHDSLRAFDRVVRPMGADSPQREPTAAEAKEIRRILDSLRAIRPPRPDSIRNGADDDGSGTVGLLEIAEWFAKGPATKRSILFVSHAAEEMGLLGSAWYTDHSTVPVDSIVADIDMDMIGRGDASDLPGGGPAYLELVGSRRLSTEYGDILDRVNATEPVPFKFNLAYDAPGHPLQYYCRADHYSYARYGIPSVSLSRGEHLDYHQVTDEAQYIDYDAALAVTRFVADAARAVADLDHRPKLDRPKGDPKAVCKQ